MLKRKYMVVTFLAILGLTTAILIPISRGPSTVEYDPWLDFNDDGRISYKDLFALAAHYGSTGEPINKTALLLGLQARVDSLNASLVELQSKLATLEARITALEAPSRYLLVTTYPNETVLKLDPYGNVVWNVDIGSTTMEACWNPTDGSIYVVSIHNLTKLDSNGSILWNNDISFMHVPGVGGPSNLDVDPKDGSVYVVAHGGPGYPFGVHKYASNGTFLWYRQVNFQSVAVNPTDGSVYLMDFNQGVFKYDSHGNLIWQTPIPGYQNGYACFSLAVDPIDGSVIAAYRIYPHESSPVVKLDTNGNIIWQTLTPTDTHPVAVDPYRNAVYVTGSGYLHKLCLTNGSITWERYISPNILGVAVDVCSGSVYVSERYGERNLYRVDPNDGSILQSKNFGMPLWGISFESKFVPVGCPSK